MPIERVCDLAKAKLENVVIMGVTKQGQVQLISTFQDLAEVLLVLRKFQNGFDARHDIGRGRDYEEE